MTDRKLELKRPLLVFDLETTGLDVAKDRIVEISCVKITPDGNREVRTRRLNPGIPISPQATAVHGITDADVAAEPSFTKVARSLFELLDGCDLSGYNIEHFDLPMLVREFERAGLKFPKSPVSVIDTYKVFIAQEPRDLGSAYRFYCGGKLDHAHSAEADAMAAAEILTAQINRYDDLPTNIADLHEFCHPQHPDWIDPDGKILWKGDEAVLGFGKYRDHPLREICDNDREYLEWVAFRGDFSEEVKRIARAALKGEFPSPSTSAPSASH